MTNIVGVLVLPPLNPTSIPLIKQYTTNKKVISNYKLGVPHRRIKFGDNVENKIYGDTSILIDKDKYDIANNEKKHMGYLIELIPHIDKLIIVAPNKVPIIFALVATQLLHSLDNVRLIVGNKVYEPKDIHHEISKHNHKDLENQWNNLTQTKEKRPNQQPKQYKEHELLNTPNGCVLRPYQQQIVDFVEKVKRAGLFVDMGLGKTLSTLATIDKLANENKIDITKPILVVAPIMVALDTWSREAEKWGYDMDVLINIKLSPKKRTLLYDQLLEPTNKLTLVTTNPAQLKSMVEYFTAKRIIPPFQVAIVDELSQFKSATAQRFKFLTTLTRRCEYFFGLTGTPAPNNLLDIWSQMIVIDSKNSERLGYNFFEYRAKYFEPDVVARDGTVYKWKLKAHADEKIYDMLRPTTISMRSEGLIDLPDITYTNQYVKLPPKALKVYKKLDEDLRKQLLVKENNTDSSSNIQVELSLTNGNIQIPNSAVLASKLAQLASGALYDNVMDLTTTNTDVAHYEVIHDEKLKLLKDMVETATSPILIFFNFQSELDRLSQYIEFEHLHPKRDDVRELIAKWNAGDVPVLVAHPGSVGHGLNLQDGGHTMVWLSIPWSNEQYRQAVKRLYRSGQTNTVSVIHIVAEDTNDLKDIERLSTKEEGQNELMAALEHK